MNVENLKIVAEMNLISLEEDLEYYQGAIEDKFELIMIDIINYREKKYKDINMVDFKYVVDDSKKALNLLLSKLFNEMQEELERFLKDPSIEDVY